MIQAVTISQNEKKWGNSIHSRSLHSSQMLCSILTLETVSLIIYLLITWGEFSAASIFCGSCSLFGLCFYMWTFNYFFWVFFCLLPNVWIFVHRSSEFHCHIDSLSLQLDVFRQMSLITSFSIHWFQFLIFFFSRSPFTFTLLIPKVSSLSLSYVAAFATFDHCLILWLLGHHVINSPLISLATVFLSFADSSFLPCLIRLSHCSLILCIWVCSLPWESHD